MCIAVLLVPSPGKALNTARIARFLILLTVQMCDSQFDHKRLNQITLPNF